MSKRSKNFTESEKNALIGIIQRYAAIIENKKTDGVSVKAKQKCWERITEEFNAITVEGNREVSAIKVFYQNSKRNCRKGQAEKNKEAYMTLLEEKLDNRTNTEDNNSDHSDELQKVLHQLKNQEKKEIKKTGGGSCTYLIPTGGDVILGELLADQLRPLENTCDDATQYFGNVELIETIEDESQNPTSSQNKKKKRQTASKKKMNINIVKKRIYQRKLVLINNEIKQKQRLFLKDLELKNLLIKKTQLEIEKLN